MAILSSGCSACVDWKPCTFVAAEIEEEDDTNSLYTMLGDVAFIVSTVTAALEGRKHLRENDESAHVESHAVLLFPMLPICAEALERIQSVAVGQGINVYGVEPSIHSLLVTTAGQYFHRHLASNEGKDLPTK